MRLCWAAFAAMNLVLCASALAQPASTLTLNEALERVVQTHPALAVFQHQRKALTAEVQQAALRPALTVDAELENAVGTGVFSGTDSAELTLSLASVLESAAKRAARGRVAASRLDALTLKEEADRFDLLAEVARRYLDALMAQETIAIAQADVAQRERTVTAAARRVEVGASPEAVRLTAAASLARAQLQYECAKADLEAARRRLSILWGERTPSAVRVEGALLTIPITQSFESLAATLDRNPELRQFADEGRLREARLQLARTERRVEPEWRLGVRRLEETSDWAAVAGISVPLGTRARAEPAIRIAQTELASLEIEREAQELTLYATLTEAYARLVGASTEVILARDEVLPRLMQAAAAAERAYRGGALSYLEWAQVQGDITTTRREQLTAALEAHRALIEIQRLTGEPFLAASPAEPSR